MSTLVLRQAPELDLPGGPPTLVFDIHGVLLGRREPAGHRSAGEVLARLREAGLPMAFVTNSSSVRPADLALKLSAAGIDAPPAQIVTAATVMAERVAALPGIRRLFAVGSDALRQQVELRLGRRARWVEPEEANTVLVGRDPQLDEHTLARLRRASEPTLLATCRDIRFPNEHSTEAGPGPTVDRVEQALGLAAQVVGKPDPFVLRQVLGLSPDQLRHTWVIGDSPAQDVALARRAGARAVLLGAAAGADPDPEHRPDHTIEALDELWQLLEVHE